MTSKIEPTMQQPKVYFTTSISDEGITAQLMVFLALYKFGKSLNYEYVHTPLVSKRSGDPNIYNHLGLNNYFPISAEIIENECNIIEFCIHFASRLRIKNCARLQKRIRKQITNQWKKNKRPILIRFFRYENWARVGRKRQLKGMLKTYIRRWVPNYQLKNPFRFSQPPSELVNIPLENPEALILRDAYWKARLQEPMQSRFQNGKIKILLHIRQGDTALIRTPWQTYITPSFMDHKYTESSNLNDVDEQYIHVADFYNFLNQLQNTFPTGTLSTVVSSDGFSKGIARVETIYEKMGLSHDQMIQIKESATTYDKEEFSCFESIQDCTCIVGEEAENLYDLIYASTHADVIIYGTQQSMIQKLMVLYGNLKNPPLLIQLHRKKGLTPQTIDSSPAETSQKTVDSKGFAKLLLPATKFDIDKVVLAINRHIDKP